MGRVCRIGVGRADLTPAEPGPTSGWSFDGRRDAAAPTELDQRLYATAVALEDDRGERVVLVNADLHCGGRHLWRAAVEASGLSADRVVMSGSHSHAGPGQRYGGLMYTLLAGSNPFGGWSSSRRLAPLVGRAVEQAIGSLTPGGITLARAPVADGGSNRATPAWDHYDEAEVANFLQHGPGSLTDPSAAMPDRLRDPRVTVLVARSDDGERRAALAWYAVHGTSLGRDWPEFGADLWGPARTAAERSGYLVGFGGGSSGDISPLPLDDRGRLRAGDAHRPEAQGPALASAVGGRIGEVVAAAIAEVEDEVAAFSIGVAHEEWRPRSSGLPRPMSGLANAGGGIDGPTDHWADVVDGVRSPRYQDRADRVMSSSSGHRPKVPIVNAYTGLPIPVGWLVGLLAPRRLPLHVVRVGDHAFASVPGEATTMSGWRVEEAVRAATGCRSASVIGFAGDYGGYWVTPEEYREQRYEAASTIFGVDATSSLVARLAALAGTVAP